MIITTYISITYMEYMAQIKTPNSLMKSMFDLKILFISLYDPICEIGNMK